MTYKVKMTSHAVQQMKAAARYIAKVLHEPAVAEKWMARVKKEIASLNAMPRRHPLVDEEPWRAEGIRRMRIENFAAYYWVDEIQRIVWVTAVVYGRQDQPSELRNMPME